MKKRRAIETDSPWYALIQPSLVTRQVASALGVDQTDRSAMQMIECGLHSGLPACCIAFFVKVWWPWVRLIDALPLRARAETRQSAWLAYGEYQQWSGRPGYVPCPKCVVGRSFVEVLSCDCEKKRLRAATKHTRAATKRGKRR